MNPLTPILFVEILRSLIGFSLLIVESIRLKESLSQKPTKYLLSILFFYNMIFFTRAIGIVSKNDNFRQAAPAMSGLLTAIFLILWGSSIINLTPNQEKLSLSMITIGIFSFLFGVLMSNVYIAIIGLLLFMGTTIWIVRKMRIFVFKSSPYIQARYRVFLMFIAIIIMIIFEGSGVIAMREVNYNLAAGLFTIEILGRITMASSIFLPTRIKMILSHIIY